MPSGAYLQDLAMPSGAYLQDLALHFLFTTILTPLADGSESVTLLKNENDVLPLDRARALDILVAGPTGNSLVFQSGGWTIHWHGAVSEDEFW
jgi:hypothetical protein